MKKGITHFQDGTPDTNNNNIENSNSISSELLTLSFERDLRKILNEFVTPDNICSTINSHDFCETRTALDGNFNVYIATGEEHAEVRIKKNEDTEVFRVLEMPFITQSQLDSLQKKIANKEFKNQRYIFVNKIIELTDLILQELKFTLSQSSSQQILKNEFEFFMMELCNPNQTGFPLELINYKIKEWLYKFPQVNSDTQKEFREVCLNKLKELLHIGEELKKLSEQLQPTHKNNTFHFVEFKPKTFMHNTDFTQAEWIAVINFAKKNLNHQKTDQEKDCSAVMKFNGGESIYIADFQKQRLKALKDDKAIEDWLHSTHKVLVCTLTSEEKRTVRLLAKKLLDEKKISSEKIGLINLTYNLYELLQCSSLYPILKYFLDSRKHFLFLHSHKFCQLFPLPARVELSELSAIKAACKDVGALDVFYQGLESFVDSKTEFGSLKILASSILTQEIWQTEERLRIILQNRWNLDETMLQEANSFLEGIHVDKYQGFLKSIFSFLDKYLVGKSEEQFNFYFEKFKQMIFEYIGKVKNVDVKHQSILAVACQFLAYEYHKDMIIHEAFSVVMQQCEENTREIERSIAAVCLTRRNSNSNSSFPFVGNIGGTRGRSRTSEEPSTTNNKKKSGLQTLKKTPGSRSATALPGLSTSPSTSPQTSSSDSDSESTKLVRGRNGSHAT